MSCADVQTIQAGNASKTQFSFDFPYLFKSEIQVSFWNATTKEWDVIAQTDATYPWQVTDANPTIVEFTSTAPPAPAVPVDPGETAVDNVRIRRVTNIDDIRALFNPGSAIRSDDLNKNFEQLRYAIQEANCQGISDEVYQYLLDNYWDRFDNTLYSADAWRSDDATIATTAALDQRFQDEVNDTLTKAELASNGNVMPNNDNAIPTTGAVNDYINEVITNDIGTDGTGITITDDGDGTITLGLASNSIDFDRIKNSDIITYAEQDAGSPAAADSNIFTASAAARRFDTVVQLSTPSGSNWEVGKTWLQNDEDRTLSIWDGSSWVGVASGGTFTELNRVIYVDSINGDDANNGHRISTPKKTIKAAVNDINADATYGDGSVVIVAPGVYQEVAPIDIQRNNVSIVGQALRSTIIHPTPATETNSLFRVNSGSYLANLTFTGVKASGTRGHASSIDPDATYGLPENQGWNVSFYPGATIVKSPYIQNCTNFSDSEIDNSNLNAFNPAGGSAGDTDSAMTGGGLLVDGSVVDSASPLRSMVCDSYTHVGLDGPGILVTNNGYCQATSSYAFFNHYHIKCLNGGQANLAASTTDFGRYSLIADGQSVNPVFTADLSGSIGSGEITFTIDAPVADPSWHGSETRPQSNMLVELNGITYPILSATANGTGWDVTISRPNPADRSENLGLDGAVFTPATASFYLRSMIASSGHTMEYVGSGTNYSALPENGGVPNDSNQIVELNSGKVWTATTDHNGKFKVGDIFEVDQQTGFVTIPSGSIKFSNYVEQTSGTGSAIVPTGTTAQRPAASAGYLRFNTDTGSFEGYDGSTWDEIGGAGALTPADIGVTVQAYDADTAKTDVAQTFTAAQTFSSNLTINGQSDLRLADADSSNWVAFQAPSTVSSNVTWTLPSSDGTSGQVLSTNGSGTLSWATAGGGGSALEGTTDTASPFETSLGYEAGLNNTGTNNTFIGYQTGKANTTGSFNTAVGYQALDANTSANFNNAFGSFALTSNTTGDTNVAVGSSTLRFNTTGSSNTAIGHNTLESSTLGADNVAVGRNALDSNTGGGSNVAVGRQALDSNTNGNDNVAIGRSALAANTTGTYNTAVGYQAGNTVTTGTYNTSLGYNAQASSATAVGDFTLGDANVANLRCADTTISSLSDIRDKTNVENLPFGLDFINKLRPVQFDWAARDGSRKGKKDFGFIAQELDEVETHFNTQPYTRLVHKGNPEMWEADPMKTYPILIKAVQELSARLEKLENAV